MDRAHKEPTNADSISNTGARRGTPRCYPAIEPTSTAKSSVAILYITYGRLSGSHEKPQWGSWPLLSFERPIFDRPYLENYWADFAQILAQCPRIMGAQLTYNNPRSSGSSDSARQSKADFSSHRTVAQKGISIFPSLRLWLSIGLVFAKNFPRKFWPKIQPLFPTNPWVLDGSEHNHRNVGSEALTARPLKPFSSRLCGHCFDYINLVSGVFAAYLTFWVGSLLPPWGLSSG